MKNVIILFTPTHTGTHFVRMLLEAHPAISTAIGEDYRIDSAFRAGYVLSGLGVGGVDPLLVGDRANGAERMLLEYFRDFLLENIDKSAFQRALEYWQTISSEKKLPMLHYERHLRNVQEEFRSVGIELAPKRERYLLYRGHCHGEYEAHDLSRLTRNFPVVVTVRHPLLSILTTMRRNPLHEHGALIESFVKAMQCVFKLDGAFFFCTDLWQTQAQRMASLFTFLDLPLCKEAEQFMTQRPRINCTVAKGEKHGKHNYCLAFEHPADFLGALEDARGMFEQGRLHPLLEPSWTLIQQVGLLAHYQRLGYSMMPLERS